MNETQQTTKKLLTIIAVISVTAVLISLPYQSLSANAAPAGKKYQVYVTLTNVPTNAGGVLVNASLSSSAGIFFSGNTLVSSPSTGDTVKFVITVPSGASIGLLTDCATQQANYPNIVNCDSHQFTSKVTGPIRVDLEYPTT